MGSGRKEKGLLGVGLGCFADLRENAVQLSQRLGTEFTFQRLEGAGELAAFTCANDGAGNGRIAEQPGQTGVFRCDAKIIAEGMVLILSASVLFSWASLKGAPPLGEIDL